MSNAPCAQAQPDELRSLGPMTRFERPKGVHQRHPVTELFLLRVSFFFVAKGSRGFKDALTKVCLGCVDVSRYFPNEDSSPPLFNPLYQSCYRAILNTNFVSRERISLHVLMCLLNLPISQAP